jgi:integrase
LRAALNHAFRDELVTSDAAWRKVKSFKGVDSARVRYLTVAQARRLVNATDSEFRPLVQAALQTGCRYSELARLEVADFNPDSGTLAIRQSKSGKARHVVLTDEGVFFFRQLTAARAGSEIMLRKANGEAWRASHQLRPTAQACQHAKIDPPISFHALRHTWASHAVMNGVPLLVVVPARGNPPSLRMRNGSHLLPPAPVTDELRSDPRSARRQADREVE